MPIDRTTFETLPSDADGRNASEDPTDADRVLSFLADRPEAAFTLTELRRELRVPRGSIGVTMARLEDAGLVRHRGGHWALAR